MDNLYYPSLAPDSGFLLAPPTDVSGPDRFTSFHCRPWHAKTVGAHHGWTAFIPEKAGSQITATRTLQVFEADLTEIAPIVVVSSPGIVAAIPLEPSARIVRVNPAFFSPHLERLRRVHAEVIQ